MPWSVTLTGPEASSALVLAFSTDDGSHVAFQVPHLLAGSVGPSCASSVAQYQSLCVLRIWFSGIIISSLQVWLLDDFVGFRWRPIWSLSPSRRHLVADSCLL